MALLYRIKRLIKADAHAVVEGLEEPKWILAQAIRDMESALGKQAAKIADQKKSLDALSKQMQDTKLWLENVTQDIDLAMDEKREDIAKSLIKQMLIQTKNLKQWVDSHSELKKQYDDSQKDFMQKKQKFDAVCERAKTTSFSDSSNVAFDESQSLCAVGTDIEHEVELEFLKRMKTRKGGSCAN